MDSNDKKTREQKVLYDALWLELEPRLQSPRKKKDRVFLWLSLLAIGVTTIGFWCLSDQRVRLKTEATTTPLSELPRQAHEDLLASALSIELTKDRATRETVSKKTFTSILKNEVKISDQKKVISTIGRHIRTSALKQSKGSLFPIDSNPSSKKILTALTPRAAINLTNLESLSISSSDSLLLLSYSRDRIDLRIKFLNLNEEEDSHKFKMGFSTLALRPFAKTGVSSTSYEDALQASLKLLAGVELELWSSYQLTRHLGLGLGVSYNQYWERFDLDNVVTEERKIINPEAFVAAGSFLEAEQCLTVHTAQRIRNYNAFSIWNLNPQLEYQSEVGSFNFLGAVGMPVIINQNYRGTLFDEQGLVTHEHPVFDDRRFARLGLRLNFRFDYSWNNGVGLGVNLNYRQFFGPNEGQVFQQAPLSSLGVGLMSSYSF